MTERKSPHNQTTVPVLDRNSQPLAPARPSRVRRWLESGRAHKVWVKGIFAVQINDLDAATAITGSFALNLDPGETTGVAITRESPDGKCRAIVGAYEHQHRNKDIHYQLDGRRRSRQRRVRRYCRRPARFNNRANTHTKGRLPPSIQSLVDDTEALIQTMCRLHPIKRIRAEYLRFDTQLMQDPDIKGKEYQQGTLQHWQLRHYIFARDHSQCQYCDRLPTDKNPLTMDHIVPQSRNGPTVVSNLVAACQQCNTRKTNQPADEFLASDPARLSKIQEQVTNLVPLTSAGHLNSVMPAMLEVLKATGLPVTINDGAHTAYTRHQLDIPKSHVNDDACLDLPTEVGNLTGPVTLLRRQRRHNRQSINCNASGTPYSKDFPAYSRLSRSQQGYTTPPAHSTAPRRLKSIGSADMIRIVHRTGQTFTGRATLSLRDKRIKMKGMGKSRQTVSAPTSRARLVAHRTRWTAIIHKPVQ